MRTAEYYSVLTASVEAELMKMKIESIHSGTDWNTTYFKWVIYDIDDVEKELKEKERFEDLEELKEEGVVCVFDLDCLAINESFDEAIKEFFYYKYEKGDLLDNGK